MNLPLAEESVPFHSGAVAKLPWKIQSEIKASILSELLPNDTENGAADISSGESFKDTGRNGIARNGDNIWKQPGDERNPYQSKTDELTISN